MTGHVGRTLYANLWKHANPFVRGTPSSTSARFSQPTSFNDAFQNILGKRSFRTSSSSSSSYTRNPRQITRRFASGGFFVLTTSPNSTAAVESGTACAISSEKITCYGASRQPDWGRLATLRRSAWSRSFHTSRAAAASRQGGTASKKSNHNDESVLHKNPARHEEAETKAETSAPYTSSINPQGVQGGSGNHYLRTHLHRPTRDELLAAATGFWSRLKVRFKWFSIRSVRPFNMDEIGAFFSWVLLGHVLWVILGTTTFFSLLILAINTVFAQGKPEDSDYSTHSMLIISQKLWRVG